MKKKGSYPILPEPENTFKSKGKWYFRHLGNEWLLRPGDLVAFSTVQSILADARISVFNRKEVIWTGKKWDVRPCIEDLVQPRIGRLVFLNDCVNQCTEENEPWVEVKTPSKINKKAREDEAGVPTYFRFPSKV